MAFFTIIGILVTGIILYSLFENYKNNKAIEEQEKQHRIYKAAAMEAINKAKEYIEDEDYEKALEYIRIAIQFDPVDPMLKHMEEAALNHIEEIKILAFEKALKTARTYYDNADYHSAAAYMEVALSFHEDERVREIYEHAKLLSTKN